MAPVTSEAGMRSLQQREVDRYYQPWLSAHGSSLSVASHVDSIAKHALHNTGFQPKISRDKSLTAFAQLIAIRLDVRRCMISLIDSTSQYILSEATRSSSLAGDGSKANNDELWLGSAVLSRPDAICEHCTLNTCTGADPDGQLLTTKGLIVNDCRLDDRFKDRPYVVAEPGVRFYAGVPLVSRNGVMIGACAVSDDNPRDGLRVGELRLLQETASSAMEHLEWARDRVDRFKGERIVRGMASFIEGCTSLREEANGDDPEAQQAAIKVQAERERVLATRPALVSRGSAQRMQTIRRPGSTQQPPTNPLKTQSKDGGVAAVPKGDAITRMFARAVDILRESTLADGAVIFGATATSDRANNMRTMPTTATGLSGNASVPTQPSPGSDSDKQDSHTSDSDSTPAGRPCKILAFSLADEQARDDIQRGSALTLGTLEKYFSLFPQGRAFSFNDQGAGFSSEEESASDREAPNMSSPSGVGDGGKTPRARVRRRRMDHKELLKKIPGAKSVVFLPLYDYSEEKLMAGAFLWSTVNGRMMSLDADLSYLRAFGNSVVSETIRINMQRNEAAKTTFIASMSHELRSPLHGILGAAEFLMDTAADAYQSGLITSITTCGRTLLDTLNHVLDYSKINKLGRAQMRKHAKQNKLINLPSDSSFESLNMTAEIDLGVLVEEVAEAVTAGHAFKKLPGAGSAAVAKSTKGKQGTVDSLTSSSAQSQDGAPGAPDGQVAVLLDISPRRSWLVRTQPGALRRIIMNLLGNALKYTTSGFVAVSLRAQESTNPNSTKIHALIRVVDSGKGMSETFQRDRLFVPFSQEDPFQPGTGLGLSIVKQIVDSLGGSVEVRSEEGVGTEIDVHLSLVPAAHDAVRSPDEDETFSVVSQTFGKHLVLLDPPTDGGRHPPAHPVSRLETTLGEVCSGWFGLKVSHSETMTRDDAAVYMYSEPPPIERLVQIHRERKVEPSREVPIIIIYMSAEDAITMSRRQQKILGEIGAIVEVVPQPCGPRKLARVLNHCFRRIKEAQDTRRDSGDSRPKPALKEDTPASPGAADDEATPPGLSVDKRQPAVEKLASTISAAVSYPSPPPFDPATPALEPYKPTQKTIQPSSAPHVLLVDDNKINRQLLVMFMRKHKYSYAEAENGQEALDVYKSSCLPGPQTLDQPTRRFDFVLMDISMPVMDGMEATRRIREFEKENQLGRAGIIALTGLASAQAQTQAETAGIDVFLPKPVKFAELKTLLTAGPKEEGSK